MLGQNLSLIRREIDFYVDGGGGEGEKGGSVFFCQPVSFYQKHAHELIDIRKGDAEGAGLPGITIKCIIHFVNFEIPRPYRVDIVLETYYFYKGKRCYSRYRYTIV